LTEDGVSSLKRTVPNDCFLVKRLELGYVFYIIKHATISDKAFLQSYWEHGNISGNEESVKFESSFYILAFGIETNVLKHGKW
jgi:hypothetical protein